MTKHQQKAKEGTSLTPAAIPAPGPRGVLSRLVCATLSQVHHGGGGQEWDDPSPWTLPGPTLTKRAPSPRYIQSYPSFR